MWIINNKQLNDISRTMRIEFERRACYILSKENCTKGSTLDEVKDNITKQMDRIILYDIKDENNAIQFIRLSFLYPILQEKEWNEALEEELSNYEKSESEKMNLFLNYYPLY